MPLLQRARQEWMLGCAGEGSAGVCGGEGGSEDEMEHPQQISCLELYKEPHIL